MNHYSGSVVGIVIVIVLLVAMLWAIGSCTRIFYDPFEGSSSSAASQPAASAQSTAAPESS